MAMMPFHMANLCSRRQDNYHERSFDGFSSPMILLRCRSISSLSIESDLPLSRTTFPISASVSYVLRIRLERLPGLYHGYHRTMGFFLQRCPSPPEYHESKHYDIHHSPLLSIRLQILREQLIFASLATMLPVIP